jgi:hypothetical protein
MNEDSKRLDYLQSLTNQKIYSGKVVLRDSTTGRGWRLHESSDGYSTVREAIDVYMEANPPYEESQNAKITPRPWATGGNIIGQIWSEKTGMTVAFAVPSYKDGYFSGLSDAQVNADLIVKSVKSHDTLIKVIKQTLNLMDSGLWECDSDKDELELALGDALRLAGEKGSRIIGKDLEPRVEIEIKEMP